MDRVSITQQMQQMYQAMCDNGFDGATLEREYEYAMSADVWQVISALDPEYSDAQADNWCGIDIVCDVNMPPGYVMLKRMDKVTHE